MPLDSSYRKAAKTLETAPPFIIDPDARVLSDEGGAWVQVWIWIPRDHARSHDPETPPHQGDLFDPASQR